MVGQVLGAVGALPEIFTELEISYFLLRRLLGVRTEGDKKAAKVSEDSRTRTSVLYPFKCRDGMESTSGITGVVIDYADLGHSLLNVWKLLGELFPRGLQAVGMHLEQVSARIPCMELVWIAIVHALRCCRKMINGLSWGLAVVLKPYKTDTLWELLG